MTHYQLMGNFAFAMTQHRFERERVLLLSELLVG